MGMIAGEDFPAPFSERKEHHPFRRHDSRPGEQSGGQVENIFFKGNRPLLEKLAQNLQAPRNISARWYVLW